MPDRKFKKGDYVRIIDRFGYLEGDVKTGDIAIAQTDVDSYGRFFVRFLREDINHSLFSSRHGQDWGAEQFERTTPPDPTFTLDFKTTNVDEAIQAAQALAVSLGRPVGVKHV